MHWNPKYAKCIAKSNRLDPAGDGHTSIGFRLLNSHHSFDLRARKCVALQNKHNFEQSSQIPKGPKHILFCSFITEQVKGRGQRDCQMLPLTIQKFLQQIFTSLGQMVFASL